MNALLSLWGSLLQHNAIYVCVAVCRRALQHNAECTTCNPPHVVAVCGSVLQHMKCAIRSTLLSLQYTFTAMTLPCAIVCGSLLQCVALCCKCDAVYRIAVQVCCACGYVLYSEREREIETLSSFWAKEKSRKRRHPPQSCRMPVYTRVWESE